MAKCDECGIDFKNYDTVQAMERIADTLERLLKISEMRP